MSGKIWLLALLCGAALAAPAVAQEATAKDEVPAEAPAEAADEAPPASDATKAAKDAKLEQEPMHRWGAWTISVAGWKPSMVGAQDEIAVVYPEDKSPYPLYLGSSASTRVSWLVAYHLPKNLGSIVLHYDSMNDDAEGDYFSPGRFIYGESLAYPEYRGAFDDGFADGVRASTSRKTRETRLEFSGTAWESPRTRGTWGAGVRNVDYNKQLQVDYYAIVPNLPPVIPPAIDPAPSPETYLPRPDYVNEQSDFSGTGAGASLDVEFRLHPRFSIISGLSLGLLRGKVSTTYESRTSFYFTTDPEYHILTKDELFDILNNGTQNEIKAVGQTNVSNLMYVPDFSQSAQTYDIYVGFQAAVWRGLKVFATFRELYYNNVGARAAPTPDLTIKRESLSVGYEGYLVGLSWRF